MKGVFIAAACVVVTATAMAQDAGRDFMKKEAERNVFEKAAAADWQEVLSDSCTGTWKDQWFLDGEIGSVKTGKDGMTLTAGPEFKNDAHHMVLWTKESFAGDLKIEYDYVRQDDENRCVNIIYIQATGSGEKGYEKDITKWCDKRKVPSMRTYFNNINTYHISYAAFGNDGKSKTSYIRGRRYTPPKGLRGTELAPEYKSETLFAKGVTHHITIVKKDREIHMRVENPDEVAYFYMGNEKLPVITGGRIGLRHMYTRSATYKNFSVSILDADTLVCPENSDPLYNNCFDNDRRLLTEEEIGPGIGHVLPGAK